MVGLFGEGAGFLKRCSWWEDPVDGGEGKLVHTGVGQAGFCCSGRSRDRGPPGPILCVVGGRRAEVVRWWRARCSCRRSSHMLTIKENFRDGHSEAPLETSLVWQGVQDGWMRN